MSPTRTKGGWLQIHQIPSCAKIVEQGQVDREQKKQAEADEKRQQKAFAAKEAAEKLRAVEEQNERQRQLQQQLAEQRQQELLASQPRPQQPPPMHQVANISQVQPMHHPGMVVQNTTVVVQQQNNSNVAAILLNIFLLPGLGQLILGRTGLGIALIVSWFASIGLCFFCVGFALLPIVWLVAVVDAAMSHQPTLRNYH